MAESTSWILEIRDRLSRSPQREPVVETTERRAILVLLFVDARELWALMMDRGGGVFPGAPVGPDEDAWTAALRGAKAEAGIAAEGVLRLGELESLELPTGGLAVPCIGALPLALVERAGGPGGEIFRVPLSAFANPTLVEETVVETSGERRVVRGYHIGSRRIHGLAAHVLEDLLATLHGDTD